MARAATRSGTGPLAQAVSTGSDPADPSEPIVSDRPVRTVVTGLALVDVVGALASGTLANSAYFFDNAQTDGAIGHGTASLSTPLSAGDLMVWVSMGLECEAFVRLSGIRIDAAFAEFVAIDCGAYTGTAVVYWTLRVLKTLVEPIPYQLEFRLGSRSEPMIMPVPSYLLPPRATPAGEGQ